jgi:hypothetical protein
MLPKKSMAGREFAPAFAKLWNGQPVWCHATQRAISGLPRPTLAVVDVRRVTVTRRARHSTPQIIASYGIGNVKSIAGADCPVLSWTPLPSATILRFLGPEELGGLGDLKAKIEAEAKRSGKAAEEVAMSVREHLCFIFGRTWLIWDRWIGLLSPILRPSRARPWAPRCL